MIPAFETPETPSFQRVSWKYPGERKNREITRRRRSQEGSLRLPKCTLRTARERACCIFLSRSCGARKFGKEATLAAVILSFAKTLPAWPGLPTVGTGCCQGLERLVPQTCHRPPAQGGDIAGDLLQSAQVDLCFAHSARIHVRSSRCQGLSLILTTIVIMNSCNSGVRVATV